MNLLLLLIAVLLVSAQVLGSDEGESLDPAVCRGDARYDPFIALFLLSLGQSALARLLNWWF